MNNQLLDTLLLLFANFSQEGEHAHKGRELVERYLNHQFNPQVTQQYIEKFDSILKGSWEVDLISICKQFNDELTIEQKYFIVVKLIELIYTDKIISEEEERKIWLVATHLNLKADEFELLFRFITTETPETLNLPNQLIIDGNESGGRKLHIRVPTLRGSVSFLLIPSGNIYFFRYHGETNLLISGQHIQQHVVYVFHPGNSLSSSKMLPISYHNVKDKYLGLTQVNKIIFEVRGISYKFPTGYQALHPFNLLEESGRLIAIMGSSGAGKSTLLSVLNGTNKPTTGSVTINGIDLHREPGRLEGVIGFVAQEDLLIEELTVFQNLYFNAKLCFSNFSDSQLRNKVENTLRELGLLSIRDQVVGDALNPSISGGQRKRLNIALELMREPAVLFVDEPTSGLSSLDSENVMDLLKDMTNKGKLVFVVIHQPSSELFKLFDKLLLLDTGGYPVYYGPPLDGIAYFRRHSKFVNPEHVVCRECSRVRPEQMFAILEASTMDVDGRATKIRRVEPAVWYRFFREQNQQLDRPPEKPPFIQPKDAIRPGAYRQFRIFMHRDALSKLGRKAYLLITVFEAPLLGLILGVLLRAIPPENQVYSYQYNDNIPTFLFISVLVALFIGLTQSAEEIIRDQKVLQREAFLHLNRQSYILAKTAVQLGISAFQMLVYTAVILWVLEVRDHFLATWMILFSTAAFANLLGLNASLSFQQAVSVYILIPLLLIPQIILSGTMVPFQQLNPWLTRVDCVPLVGDIMASRWAYEALAVTYAKDNPIMRHSFADEVLVRNLELATAKLTELTKEVRKLEHHATHGTEHSEACAQTLELLRNESQALSRTYHLPAPDFIDRPLNSSIDSVFKARFTRWYTSADHILDVLHTRAQERLDSINKRYKAQDSIWYGLYYNNRLMDYVTGKLPPSNGVVVVNNRYFSQEYLIFQYPSPDAGFLNYRTHFYAPAKRFANRLFDTFWFNIVILWVFNLALYGFLSFKVFPLLKFYTAILLKGYLSRPIQAILTRK